MATIPTMRRNGQKDPKLTALGANIRGRRASQKLSLSDFSDAGVLSKQQLSNVEHARNWPSMPAYIKICEKLKAGKIPLVDTP